MRSTPPIVSALHPALSAANPLEDTGMLRAYGEYLRHVPGAKERTEAFCGDVQMGIRHRVAEAMIVRWLTGGPLRSAAVLGIPVAATAMLTKSPYTVAIAGLAGLGVSQLGRKFTQKRLWHYANKNPEETFDCMGMLHTHMIEGSGDTYKARAERFRLLRDSVPCGVRRGIWNLLVYTQTTPGMEALLTGICGNCITDSEPLQAVVQRSKAELIAARVAVERARDEELARKEQEVAGLKGEVRDLQETDSHREREQGLVLERLGQVEAVLAMAQERLGPLLAILGSADAAVSLSGTVKVTLDAGRVTQVAAMSSDSKY
jgi:hypothetical protein